MKGVLSRRGGGPSPRAFTLSMLSFASARSASELFSPSGFPLTDGLAIFICLFVYFSFFFFSF